MIHFFVIIEVLLIFVIEKNVLGKIPRNIAWTGGPLHSECEHGANFMVYSGQYVKDNIIAVKAVMHKDDIFVLTPRYKTGVPATVWLIINGRQGVELQAFPAMGDHRIGECRAIQNAIDICVDHLGNLWILDSGIIDTVQNPRCTCKPKVVVINISLKKITKSIDLSSVTEPNSLLQNIVVEYGFGLKPYIYISDATRGAILVHDTKTDSSWTVLVCQPAAGLQLSLVKRGPLQNVLMMVRLHFPGILELHTGSLKRESSMAPLTGQKVYGEHANSMLLLGSDNHHVYFRHTECSDVLSWDTREPYDTNKLNNLHSAGPHLVPSSVSTNCNGLKHYILILDSNYGETIHSQVGTYHRITFVSI